MKITNEIKQYISGFFDGDGSITIEKQKLGYSLRVKFFQSNTRQIKWIQSYYPFLKIYGGLRDMNQRCTYELRASGKQIQPLLDDLHKYSILKYEQLSEAKKMLKLIGLVDKIEEKEAIYKRLKELKKSSTDKNYSRLTIPYIAGLFDAEGSIGIYNKTLRVKITQKSDVILL